MKRMIFYCVAIASLGYLVACGESKEADTDKNQVEVNVDASDDSSESDISYQEQELDTFEVATRGALSATGKTFVKTSYKCKKCSCTGYYGYKIDGLNQYEGACSHYVSEHKCQHGPEYHGLTRY